jgi:hypothetical protein
VIGKPSASSSSERWNSVSRETSGRIAARRSAVSARQGRIGQIPPLVDEMLAAFRLRGIAREALAALLLLSDAYRQQSLSLGLIQRVGQILTQMERFGIHGPEEPAGR